MASLSTRRQRSEWFGQVAGSDRFHAGSYYENVQSAANDLKNAGFYTVIASYPLAPKNLITGQRSHSDANSGRPPEQTNAVKALVNAARADPHCYQGKVGIVGASAGASHAAFVALDETASTDWPAWGSSNRPNFVACLSGLFDLAERDDNNQDNVQNMENYTNTTVPLQQWNVSPIAKIGSNPTVPMYFIRSEDETGSPPSEQYYMWNALTRAGVSPTLFRMWTIPSNSGHGFAYWDDPILDTSPLQSDWNVKDRIIGFFKQYLPVP